MVLSQLFESVISAAGAELLTEFFLYTLIGVFIAAVMLKKSGKLNAFTQYTPTLLTSIGMLGTFMGIVAGLLEFDTANIDTSIELLLVGLKTAFITSLAGMFFSILFKALSASKLIDNKEQPDQPGEHITTAHLYHAMQQQIDAVNALKKSIGGDNENSLVGQFKLMRSDLTDGQRKTERYLDTANIHLEALNNTTQQQQQRFNEFEQHLVEQLQSFAEMLSESATKQVVEALRGVIKDFNDKITEQFGENFKELNAAVFKLVEWQENYKNQLSDMKDQYDHGIQAITQTESSVAHIAERSNAIPENMERLRTVIEVNQHQLNELHNHLQSFATLRENAVQAIPEIQKQIDHVLEGAKTANDRMSSGVITSTEELVGAVKTSSENMTADVATSTRELISSIKTSSEDMLAGITSSAGNFVDTVKASSVSLTSGIENSTGDLVDNIKVSSENMAAGVANSTGELVGTIKTSSEDLATSITTSNNEMITAVKASSENMANAVTDSSNNLISSIHDSSTRLTESVSSSSNILKEKILASANDYQSAINEINKDLSQLKTGLKESIQTISKEFSDSITSIKGANKELFESITQGNKNLMTGFNLNP
ncbi:hypothetical protein [Endozoicomonas sp. ONNA2]|uniref:hypothetical protein n=1 Tax=Endozoicomonas sp. ONNA2 TaxID=2828741 RepID=UPI0021491686|nr:hypothetical protein [Endozoicomonas sp. ONNA2]